MCSALLEEQSNQKFTPYISRNSHLKQKPPDESITLRRKVKRKLATLEMLVCHYKSCLLIFIVRFLNLGIICSFGGSKATGNAYKCEFRLLSWKFALLEIFVLPRQEFINLARSEVCAAPLEVLKRTYIQYNFKYSVLYLWDFHSKVAISHWCEKTFSLEEQVLFWKWNIKEKWVLERNIAILILIRENPSLFYIC